MLKISRGTEQRCCPQHRPAVPASFEPAALSALDREQRCCPQHCFAVPVSSEPEKAAPDRVPLCSPQRYPAGCCPDPDTAEPAGCCPEPGTEQLCCPQHSSGCSAAGLRSLQAW